MPAFLLLFLCLDAPEKLPPPKPALAAEVGDLSGYWLCKGTELGGKAYRGVVTLEKKGDVYFVQWTVGGNSFVGVGVRQGDYLSCGWAMSVGEKVIRGVNVYRIGKGRLEGRWASLPGPDRMQGETLTFLRGLDEDE